MPLQAHAQQEDPATKASRIVSTEVDISRHPRVSKALVQPDIKQLTLGDLHGNALKLIHFLIRAGIMVLRRKNDYPVLVEYYQKEESELCEMHLDDFKEILDDARPGPQSGKVLIRLIGDVLADRGSNDYFTLLVLEWMGKNGCAPVINFSNHDAEFLQAREGGNGRVRIPAFRNFCRSFLNLKALVKRGVVTEERVAALLRDYYLPCLRLLDCSLDEAGDQIGVYTHAPVRHTVIQHLARHYGMPYKANTARELAITIETMNRIFHALAKEKGSYVSDLHFFAIGEEAFKSSEAFLKGERPVELILWARATMLGEYAFPEHLGEGEDRYGVWTRHGHDGPEGEHSLDTYLGKSSVKTDGELRVEASTVSALVLSAEEEVLVAAQVKQSLAVIRLAKALGQGSLGEGPPAIAAPAPLKKVVRPQYTDEMKEDDSDGNDVALGAAHGAPRMSAAAVE